MCGFAGFLGGRFARDAEKAKHVVERMADVISHRGPDSCGVWLDSSDGVAFAHRRLAVLDLSTAASQPMISSSGRYVVAFNGEIYNFRELKADLEDDGGSVNWRGHSDTEILVESIDHWGVERTLKKLIGMFAFSLWDRRERQLYLARDRFGEKPVYYGWQGQGENRTFLFGSELKALLAHPDCRRNVDISAVQNYLQFGAIWGARSIYDNIIKLEPGSYIRLSESEASVKVGRYWNLSNVISAGINNPYKGDFTSAVQDVEGLIDKSIARQLVADVSVGALLSGGVDSSVIVALAQKQSMINIKTFSIGFEEDGFNEAGVASDTAKALGTDHSELYVTAADARAVIPNLPNVYDEPFGDASQIPTLLVARMARGSVTVALSGDAGDEVFFGYDRHRFAANGGSSLRNMPALVRSIIGGVGRSTPPFVLDKIGAGYSQIVSALGRSHLAWAGSASTKFLKAIEFMQCDTEDTIYESLLSHSSSMPISLTANVGCDKSGCVTGTGTLDVDLVSRIVILDFLNYLPNTVLTKVDRASMSVSLETRIPYLDHQLVEFSWTLPRSIKMPNGQPKAILRQILRKYCPDSAALGPKKGFSLPMAEWLRGPLREWANDLLAYDRVSRDGYFNPDEVQKVWCAHLQGRANRQEQLWDLLMFQSWLESAQGPKCVSQ